MCASLPGTCCSLVSFSTPSPILHVDNALSLPTTRPPKMYLTIREVFDVVCVELFTESPRSGRGPACICARILYSNSKAGLSIVHLLYWDL